MKTLIHSYLLFNALAFAAVVSRGHHHSTAPTVTVGNGTYSGVYSSSYNQDFFLGVPYAQPPVGDLRFSVPASLNTSWSGTRDATQYSRQCVGYGSDQWVLGNYISEDCLYLNVIRPSGIDPSAKLPVAFWIHGGGLYQGGGSDPRYNLSFIVQQSVELGTPMIGVSINYRLSRWGFLASKEVSAAGATNLGLRDQRLALHWAQENIAAFGGDPSKVTIWGESAGGWSVAMHLVAYGGRDDGLFRAGIQESGAVSLATRLPTPESEQSQYDSFVNATGCTGSADTLQCLRQVPSDTLINLFNNTAYNNGALGPYIDGDFLQASGTTQLRQGKFVKVPLLQGANTDEGSAFAPRVINTTDQFLAALVGPQYGADNTTANTLAALYPDIPAIGIPAGLVGRPPPELIPTQGYQYKRAAAFGGDFFIHAARRLTAQSWAANNVTSYSYDFDVVVNGLPYYIGSTHFQEVAFVFNNINGDGYINAVSQNPFANKPDTFVQLSDIMSKAWVSFIVNLDPNKSGASKVNWPVYTLDNPQNIVFNVNVTNLAYVEPDLFRAEGNQYISDRLDTVFGR